MKCPVCKHKHKEWNSDKMEWEFEDTEEFIHITTITTKGNDYIAKDISIYLCPKCNNIVGEQV